jgi:high-affinity nickel-transport protein
MLLAAGFETSSQLSALILAGETNPWLLGAAFSGGMIMVDGLDGFLAANTQRLARSGGRNAKLASMTLGVLVVLFSFGLGGLELAGVELDRIALPLGLVLFAAVLGIRVWARSDSPADYAKPLAIEEG